MKHKTYKFIFLIGFLILFSFGIWQSCHAQQQLLINYPDIKGALKPGETTDLPQIIKYIYMFSLGIVGIVALLAMIIGAAQYVMSAGNPSKASDAKDRIYSAILGIIILVASVLILRTINPDLVNIGFVLPAITPTGGGGGGTTYSKCLCCGYPAGTAHCDPTKTGTAITDPTHWPTACRTIVPSQYEYNKCSYACYNVTCDSSAHRLCWSQVVLCQ
jgi:hypothetical protein